MDTYLVLSMQDNYILRRASYSPLCTAKLLKKAAAMPSFVLNHIQLFTWKSEDRVRVCVCTQSLYPKLGFITGARAYLTLGLGGGVRV